MDISGLDIRGRERAVSVTYDIEPLSDCWPEIEAIGRAHWQETMEYYRGKQPYAPSYDRYNSYDKAGWLITFTARDSETGQMVGYSLMYLVPSMHTQTMIATEDTIFLLPEYRRGRNGLRFHQFIESELRERGAREIVVTAKPGSAACRLLEHIGFSVINHQYSKHLDAAESLQAA
jgi:GNAT superfamily N-acetyltransferase